MYNIDNQHNTMSIGGLFLLFLFFLCMCHLRSDKGARVHAVNTQRNNHSLFCGSNTPRTRWPHTLYAATLFMFHLIIIRANTAVRIRFTSLISVAKHEKKTHREIKILIIPQPIVIPALTRLQHRRPGRHYHHHRNHHRHYRYYFV